MHSVFPVKSGVTQIGWLRSPGTRRAAGLAVVRGGDRRGSGELTRIRPTEHDLACGLHQGEAGNAWGRARALERTIGQRRRRAARRGGATAASTPGRYNT
jgi:hypothetical protein